ncbi:MAG: magnesium transporter CorA family protein [Candidatus Bathyarchaeota archaeon]|nr:magnesium transporter CorA family protein [Candidatus Bathyarchaeota archaeon]
MIRLVQLGNNIENIIQPEELKKQSLDNVWLELVEPTSDELQAIADATELPINFLRLPKTGGVVELRLELGFNIINFLVMQDVASTKKANPLIMAFSKNFLVTVACPETESIIKNAKERMSRTKIDPPSQVTYYIIDEVVAHHYTHIEKLENLTSKIEEEVVEKTTPETLKKIFKLKSNMISFNKVLWYERGLVFKLHKCDDSCMVSKARQLFENTHEDLTRQIDIVETYREILSDAINVHLSATSNKINFSINSLTIVIFYLTIVTTVTSFPNTIATFFGISQFGNTDIFIVTAALLASILLPFIWLWRKKWLSIKTALRQ